MRHRIIVVERQSYWEAEFARQLTSHARVTGVVNSTELEEALATSHPDLVVVDVEAIGPSLPHLIRRLSARRQKHVVVAPSLAAEWWLRELGAAAVFHAEQNRDEIVTTCVRLMAASVEIELATPASA
jgi:DNA-binding NarL/FixJ family response regulator